MPRSPARRTRRSGFSLVELLIVIAAMAILAGIVIPQVGAAIDDANESAMLNNLYELTTAIERYKIDHTGMPPDDLTGDTLAQLVSTTDVDGNVGIGPDYRYGPYMIADIPPNPLNQSAKVHEVKAIPPPDLENLTGWIYHPPSGRIWAGEKRSSKILP